MKQEIQTTRSRKKKRGWFTNTVLFFVAVGLFSAGGVLAWIATMDLPEFENLAERRLAESTKIYDRTGEILLHDIHGDVKRTSISLSEMSQYIQDATIAVEDSEFYEHKGVRPRAFARAAIANLMSGRYSEGGSTITQQVVKMALLTPEKTITRKVKEWVIAIRLERIVEKDRILEIYLNEAPYGGNMYGVEQASRTFFGKSASDVTVAEAAYLAALPQAPTFYSPYGNNRAALDSRKNHVLSRMHLLGFITEEEYNEALVEKVEFLPQEAHGIRAPHFVFYVREYLEEKYGPEVVEQGGLRVITTIDYELQQKAEETVKRYALENTKNFNASNAGMVGIDPSTGQILVMVGSRDYFDTEIDGNFNVTLANNRQPGSSFKPFVYAAAFERGYTPDTILFDLATEFQTTCNPDGTPRSGSSDRCYMPVNYDNTYRGPMTLRDALAQSVNVPAVKLLHLVGIRNAINVAQNLGVTGLGDANQYGLTLVLGGGEVSLLDMTSAYSVFANNGLRNPHTHILQVIDREGNILEEYAPQQNRAIPRDVSLQITDVLSDNAARTPAFGSNSHMHFPGHHVAAKTGTTNNYVDAWIVGYSPNFVLGAWAGNNDNSPMERRVAGFIVAPMWNEVMKEALEMYPGGSFDPPPPVPQDIKPILRGIWQGGETYVIDTVTGKLATEHTPEETREEVVIPDVHSILYWVDRNDPLGPRPQNPERDPQFRNWEYAVQRWAETADLGNTIITDVPTEYDDVHGPGYAPNIRIESPRRGQGFPGNEQIEVEVSTVTEGRFPLSRIDVFVNDVFVGSAHEPLLQFSFTPNELSNIEETNTLRVNAYDEVLNKTSAETTFSVQQ